MQKNLRGLLGLTSGVVRLTVINEVTIVVGVAIRVIGGLWTVTVAKLLLRLSMGSRVLHTTYQRAGRGEPKRRLHLEEGVLCQKNCATIPNACEAVVKQISNTDTQTGTSARLPDGLWCRADQVQRNGVAV